MKQRIAIFAVLVLSLPAHAGGALQGYRCDNECPLAKQANLHRASGTEARTVSKTVQADVATAVERHFAKV